MVSHDLPTARSGASSPPLRLAALLALFFMSGAAALIYEVLWLKELGRLFGVTAYAASTTLGVFFLGLALGGLVWGRRAERLRNPLRTYAWLEVGVGASALLYFLLFDLYRAVQAPLFGAIGYAPALLLLVKFALATGILLLPAFLMGGTLPVMAQVLVRDRSELGTRATLLYATNTIGAATGALAAGFLLPRVLGFDGSYLVAILINLVVAVLAGRWSRGRGESRAFAPPTGEVTEGASPMGLSLRAILGVAAVSGFATLGLEVVWTRMYVQVLQNSVYTFSIILTVFLAGLSLGSGLAHLLCRRARTPQLALALVMAGAGILVGLTPLFFQRLSAGLDYLRSDLGFWPYVAAVFAGTGAGIGPAVVLMGAVFPFLMKLSEPVARSAGRTVGHLAAVNTTAAILGSLVSGFLLLRLLSVWGNVRALALLYLLLALAVWPWRHAARRRWALLPIAGLVGIGLLPYGDYSRIWLDQAAGEELVEAWEGPAGAVAVARHGENLRIRVDSSYNLGSTASAVNERLQGQIPLLLHPRPHSVFFLGLGTGITAGGALTFEDVQRVVVCEVNPDVIRASRKYFAPWLQGLFEDGRATVLPEDGRTWLAASREDFDVVVADIFLSFKSGVASLYTLEHFQSVRDHLQPGGIFVQWLPMFDLGENEFAVVARTMLEVFPSVTLWRRSHSPQYPVYAMVGSLDPAPLDPERLQRRLEQLAASGTLDPNTWLLNIPLAGYAGNLRGLADRFGDAPLNTDNRTVLEYVTPITERNSRGARTAEVLAWTRLLTFCDGLLAELPPERDPHLAQLSPAQRDQVRAGLAYYGYAVHTGLGDPRTAGSYLDRYRAHLGGASP